MKKLSLIFALVLALGIMWAQGTEDFEGTTNLKSSYTANSFTNATTGVTWSYGESRDEGTSGTNDYYPITNKGLMLRRASDSYLQATISGGIGNLSFSYRKAFTGSASRSLELYVNNSTQPVYTTPSFGGGSGADGTIHPFSYDVNVDGDVTIKIKPGGTSGSNQQITVDDIVWTAYSSGGGTDPTLNVSTTSLSNFTYEFGQGPSTAQTFSVSGANLDQNNNITITTTGEYEVSLDNSTYPANGVTITPDANGSVGTTTVYVRLKAGLPVATYPNGYATVAYTGLASQNVYFDGSVTAPPPPRYFVDFEGPGETKIAYASGTVKLSNLDWNMTSAMIGTSSSDYKEGARSARLQGSASMTMLEFKTKGGGAVSFKHRSFGTDSTTDWKVEYSTDAHGAVGGETWYSVGTFTVDGAVGTFSGSINNSKSIRLRIIANGSNGSKRANIDNIEITDFYDFPNGEGTQLVNDIITVSGGHANYNYAATLGDLPDPTFQASFHNCLTLLGAGPWTIDIQNSSAEWAAYKQGGTWHSTAFANGSASLTVPAAKAADIELLTGIGNNPTVPVTLSHFSATMTAENYVQLTWISQTETNLMGYNVYRNSSDDLGSARQICPMIAGTNTSQAQTYTYLDKDLVEDGTYYYWLQNVDLDGSNAFHGPVSVVFSITGDSGSPAVPTVTQLDDAYPNPFNPNTTIRYQLEGAGKVKINIYNTRGQLVRSFERGHDAAGHFSIVWDGRDSSGRELPSGVYLYNMSSGRYSSSKKMVLKK